MRAREIIGVLHCVDGDPRPEDFLALYRISLDPHGIDVRYVNPDTAVEDIKKFPSDSVSFDAVILDGLDGKWRDVHQRLRESGYKGGIIVVSDDDTVLAEARVMKLEANTRYEFLQTLQSATEI